MKRTIYISWDRRKSLHVDEDVMDEISAWSAAAPVAGEIGRTFLKNNFVCFL